MEGEGVATTTRMNSRCSAFLNMRTERASVQFRRSNGYHEQTSETGVCRVKTTDLKRSTFMYNEEAISKFGIAIRSIMNLYYSNLCQIQDLIAIR